MRLKLPEGTVYISPDEQSENCSSCHREADCARIVITTSTAGTSSALFVCGQCLTAALAVHFSARHVGEAGPAGLTEIRREIDRDAGQRA